MMYSQYKFDIGNLARLLDIEIGNPINCMLGICKRIGISKKLAYEATEQFKAQNGDEPCTAHDIYYGMSEIVFMVAVTGPAAQKLSKPKKPSPAPCRYAGRSTTFRQF